MSRRVSLFVLLLAAVLSGGPAVAVDERAGDGVPVTIDGRGYGHGKGLSQYGALARANAGHDYRRIIDFYYPGTGWGSAGGKVEVLITGDTGRDVVVLDRTGLRVRALRSGRTWAPKPDARRWRITPGDRGRSVVSYRTRRWHEWRTVRGEAEFSSRSGPLTLVTPGGRQAYRGILRSATPNDDPRDRDTVNVVPLDVYLQGVVPREVPALWPEHAVRAQAVAARTYAAFERAAAPSGRHYQICDTAHCQVYGGFSAEHSASNGAIAATRGQVRLSGGQPIFAQFSASNGGHSVRGQFDYLPAQADAFDSYDPPDGYANGWRTTLDSSDVTRHWPGLGTLQSITVTERDGNGPYGGRALEVRVAGSESSVTVPGSRFASYLGLRSTLFDDPSVG